MAKISRDALKNPIALLYYRGVFIHTEDEPHLVEIIRARIGILSWFENDKILKDGKYLFPL